MEKQRNTSYLSIDYKNKKVQCSLKVFKFKDENNIHFMYSPHLDLTGYGKTGKEALESFKIVFADFISYTLNKKTLDKILKKLGWKYEGTKNKPQKISLPTIGQIMKKNNNITDILEKYDISYIPQSFSNIPLGV